MKEQISQIGKWAHLQIIFDKACFGVKKVSGQNESIKLSRSKFRSIFTLEMECIPIFKIREPM